MFAFCANVIGAESLSLSKQEVMALALEKNLGIKISLAEVDIGEAGVALRAGEFDPEVSARFDVAGGDGDSDTDGLEVSVGGKLSTGASYELGISSTEESTIPGRYNGFSGVTFRQPLLKNFGLEANLSELRIARYQFDLSQWEYKQTLLDTIAVTLFAFNDVYEAQQTLAIAIRNRDLAKELVDDNQRRVDLGVIAKLDIVSAQAQYAFRSERVLQATLLERRSQNRLKQLIFDDASEALAYDVEANAYTEDEIVDEFSSFMATVLDTSPRSHIAEIALEVARLRLVKDKNGKLPSLDLIAQYGFSGEGDSMGQSLDRALDGSDSSYSFGAVVRYPLLNRTAKAREAISREREEIARIDLKRVSQAIQLEFHTSFEAMKINHMRVKATEEARELANLSLEAEEKKLNAGSSSSFVVLRLQNDLASAEQRELIARTNYNRSVVEFNRLRGVLE